jgi:2,4-dienoyl-CoA reductase-like NADH-dependent reductase (Old Yellow Enzyme family)
MQHRKRIEIPSLRMAMLAGALLVSVASAQTTGTPAADPAFDNALVAYERNHWDEAYTALAQLADRGHPQAARMALQMWRFGPKLYQKDFGASAAQLERWTQLWPCTSDAGRRAGPPAQARP